jgi:hypothetical protein
MKNVDLTDGSSKLPDYSRADGRLGMERFVGFKDVDAAKKALKSAQGFVVGDHFLSIKPCR